MNAREDEALDMNSVPTHIEGLTWQRSLNKELLVHA
jgi:hypothetical protein